MNDFPPSLRRRIYRRLQQVGRAYDESRLPVSIRLILGLLIMITLGTAVLMLPGISTGPRLPVTDALFTATSALTVTGLAVRTTSTDFTPLGQVVILILIQLGGVGYMFILTLARQLIGRRVSLRDRVALYMSLGLDRPTDIIRLMWRTLLGMILIEATGALLLYLHWSLNDIAPPGRTLFYAVFHAVSAFCNAGFDLFAGLPQYPRGIPGDDFSLIVMGLLIFTGGLGIPVLSELFTRRQRRRLSLHTRITLFVVLLLTVIGWVGLYLPETRPGGVLHDDPLDVRLVHTWFQSISTRTAGFPGLEDFQDLQPESQLLVMALMFIGCAPASMGGGITTGAFAVLMILLWSYVRGWQHTQINRRTIPRGTVRRASAVLIISIFAVGLATWLLLLTHDFTFNTALFEVVSAFATCGLSLGVTEELNTFGRFLIMIMMVWGRLGALTIVIAIAQRDQGPQLVTYPEETVLIG